jgi:hypothetical protein
LVLGYVCHVSLFAGNQPRLWLLPEAAAAYDADDEVRLAGALATDLGIDGVQFVGRVGGPDERLRLKSVVVLRYVLECLELLRVVAAEDLTPLLRD